MYRLRDLDHRGRQVAAIVVVLLALPFAVAVGRAHAADWLPSGDNGIIALQGFDVFSDDPPLVGLPSTAGVYVEANPRHPGPIEFYALALPMKALGPGMGMVSWTALANAASVLVAAWVVFRRTGPGVGLWGAFVVGTIAWAQGPAQLTDPVSSNAGGIPMVALAVLAVALADGDRRLLPLFALWSAYVTQQHLGVFGFGIALTVGGVAGLGLHAWRARRGVLVRSGAEPVAPIAAVHRDAHPGSGATVAALVGAEVDHATPGAFGAPAPAAAAARTATPAEVATGDAGAVPDEVDPWSIEVVLGARPAKPPRVPRGERARAPGERWWPWVGAAFVVTVLCWLPVLIDVATGDPSNLSRLTHYTGSEGRQTIGSTAGLRQAVRALGVPPLVGRTDLSGNDLIAPASILAWLSALLVVAFLVRVVVRQGSARPALSRAALAALGLAATGAIIGANVPAFESDRLNLYRWAFVVSALTWLVIGWSAALWVDAGRGRYATRARWETPWLGVLALLALTVGSCTGAGPRDYRDGELFQIEHQLNDRVLTAVEGKHTVLILPFGGMAGRSLAESLAVDLEAAGHATVLPSYELPNYGDRRSLARNRPDAAIVIRTGRNQVTTKEAGAKVLYRADLNPGRRKTVQALVDQAKGQVLVPAEDANAIARRNGVDPLAAKLAIEKLSFNPSAVLYDPTLVGLLEAGYLTSPKLDPAGLADLRRRPLDVSWSEDRIEVVQITPGSALYLYPEIGAAP
ncbi:hypothetical protein KSP35_19025 [Aquihabitans sp. G128]|uniref:hypothetical protein n=1 Tax=Aquihabitans sp. G128 TaxID=2849779 RepID=UPI001C23EBA7|nr:hypothetical protein [Aquihabitans sp. G128]QXC60398.1 hypothetical protein KSP35_19025 [Aquihabitans sp. G128]